MKALEELTKVQIPHPVFITIGVFDGVHKGHNLLMHKLVQESSLQDCASAVITFRNNPVTILRPDLEISYLCSVEERIKFIRRTGIDYVVPLSFDYELSLLRPREFLTLLQKALNLKGMVIGTDFALGHKREGTFQVLKDLGEEMDFLVVNVDPAEIDGLVISSTSVRDALLGGEIGKANYMLGRPFKLLGQVVKGDGRGRDLGFPTANLLIESDFVIPQDGVYATLAKVNEEWICSATSIGSRPTFDGEIRVVEVHILGFEGDLYGDQIEVKFLERVRDQMKFGSVEALKFQMENDIDIVETRLNEYGATKKGF